ncbi:dihydrofolate reductase family protein [Streptomyces somaliensis DSM 40738]|uniref:Dihydrofolate reductase n=1 Tax=Streptomyces somaliensis (strain ATCC 33201 / DSM 40738 / JCM 12659 / KCTC 9044 / NCTC 11332 / NRRL B-12077 / IP 733) TaxID=1134445 RepID=A0AA44DC62_STRE0|nr:dihydrofolate reductase family protein [Streptomyces somaliensis]MCQ0023735.1 dihydrofolate reductase family protein [Streptomyces somaliensis DSM 40738]NKY13526.1 dihydrofolate reductase [Streptomyces somaliensis DSM 40738]
MRTLTYLVACSIDGFIGDPEGDASSMFRFLDEEYLGHLATEYPETLNTEGRRALGIADAPNRHFDTVVQGRGSYRLGLDAGMPSPYGHLRQIVASRTMGTSPHPDVEIVSGDLVARVRALKAEEGPLGIWLCGGAGVAGALIDEVDELVVKTYPQLYGSGMPMFGGAAFTPADFALRDVRAFGNGVVVRRYGRNR